MQPADEHPPVIHSGQHGPIWLIEVSGDVDCTALDALAEATAQGLREQPGPLVMDLGDLRFADSSLLNHLLNARAWRRLMLVDVPAQMLRVLELTGTAEVFEMHADVTAAVAAAQTDG
ncbi:STAS domain-containing protein [Streptomyces sp. VRA16 Mangrove soil]|uniref:STAS domain-containing protein n=1 Tax=Streptomyces sp. VRA16 Mangrove soil TaxID=2817434 RepID=UPI001A9F0E92|nr:STAS domain-containing protein [Streptomyces sp. VRA16 Mangrove soil]MBO1330381.1 STAS domain-containing protein [Streptomyces sp. VRA16 Mangrove soil]